MREIKFRCWNTWAKLMYPNEHFALTMDGDELQLMPECEHYDKPYLPNHGNMIYMQYTGLKDKNGKEIYEGDILKYSNGGKFKEHGLSEGETNQVSFRVGRFTAKVDLYLYGTDGTGKLAYAEVIGNRFEHPNLLENTNDSE